VGDTQSGANQKCAALISFEWPLLAVTSRSPAKLLRGRC
jgi:hypothetical protein